MNGAVTYAARTQPQTLKNVSYQIEHHARQIGWQWETVETDRRRPPTLMEAAEGSPSEDRYLSGIERSIDQIAHYVEKARELLAEARA